ncbi:MAG: CBS domain-containing protein [Vicinamibacterales bacterium]
MFAINGLDGQLFRGSLEELVQRSASTRRGRGIDQDGEESELRLEGEPASPESDRYRTAAAAYQSAVRPQADRGPVYHAYQVMSRQVLTLTPDMRVDDAWRALAGRRVHEAPVVDRQRGLVGLVSSENLLQVMNVEHGRIRDALSRTVAEVMVSPVVSTDPVSDVRRVARAMIEFRLPAVPVTDDKGAVVGIVSRGDLLRVIVNEPPLSLWI